MQEVALLTWTAGGLPKSVSRPSSTTGALNQSQSHHPNAAIPPLRLELNERAIPITSAEVKNLAAKCPQVQNGPLIYSQ
jgi:hypothetical protein